MAVKDLRLEFESYIKEDRRLSDVSSSLYLYYFDRLSKYETLNQETLIKFLRHSNNNIAKAFIKIFIDYCKLNSDYVEGYGIDMNEIRNIVIPKVTGRKKVKLIKGITKEEVETLVSGIQNEKEKIMILIEYYGALRVNELLTITYNNINFKKWAQDTSQLGEIKVFGKGNKEGICFIPNWLMERLYNYIALIQLPEDYADKPLWNHDRQYKFNYHIWDNKLNKYSTSILKRKLSSHQFRHGRLTELAINDTAILEIKKMARHSSIVSTQIYVEDNPNKLKAALIKTDSNSNRLAGYEKTIIEEQNKRIAELEAKQNIQKLTLTEEQLADFERQLEQEDIEADELEQQIDNEDTD